MPIPVTSASSPTAPPASPIASFLARLALAPRQSYKALTLWPLILRADAPASGAPAYEALADAFEARRLRVDEVGRGGQVPVVRVENRGDVAVLVLFGEELRGAKQNRVANASFLVPAASEVVIDVSCVEAGRWSRPEGAHFSATRDVLSHALRKKMAMKVHQSRERLGRFAADQHEVWEEVAARLSHSGATSPTAAYADYLHSRRSDAADYAAAFHPIERQVGFVAAIGDSICGLEIVGRPEVFARTFAGLTRAYVVDAVDAALVKVRESGAPGAARFDAPEPFLAALAGAPASGKASLGLGEDFRVNERAIGACALVAGDVVHLTAFPTDGA